MNLKQFDKIVTDQLSRSELVLMGKGMFGVSEAYCGDYLKKQLGITFQGRTTRQETLRFLDAYRPDRGPVCADKKNTELTRVSLTFCGGFSPEAIAARLQGLFPVGAAVSVTVDISATEA